LAEQAKSKHPHGIHLLLFLVLIGIELTLFGGHGILYTMGSIGLRFFDVYDAALAGSLTDVPTNELVLGMAGFVGTLIIYYLIAGAIVLLFKLVFKSFRKERVDI
jgi:hypothetical protein